MEAAAWLHDIGYAPGLATTGLHALDGAHYLRNVQHADAMAWRLVGHHSCAIIEAGERGHRDSPDLAAGHGGYRALTVQTSQRVTLRSRPRNGRRARIKYSAKTISDRGSAAAGLPSDQRPLTADRSSPRETCLPPGIGGASP
jgi:hypothetical protein